MEAEPRPPRDDPHPTGARAHHASDRPPGVRQARITPAAAGMATATVAGHEYLANAPTTTANAAAPRIRGAVTRRRGISTGRAGSFSAGSVGWRLASNAMARPTA